MQLVCCNITKDNSFLLYACTWECKSSPTNNDDSTVTRMGGLPDCKLRGGTLLVLEQPAIRNRENVKSLTVLF